MLISLCGYIPKGYSQNFKEIASLKFNNTNTGWTINQATGSTAYYKLFKGNNIVSPKIDFSNYSEVKITVNLRTYGGTSQNKVEIITESGSRVGEISASGTSLKDVIITTDNLSENTGLNFNSLSTSTSIGVGIYSITISGIPGVQLPQPAMSFANATLEQDIRNTTLLTNPLTVSLDGVTDIPVAYSISDESVATVDQLGAVTPKKFGTAKITATIEATPLYKGNSASYNVTLTAPTPVLSFESAKIEKSETDKDTPILNPLQILVDGAPFENPDAVLTYSSSSTSVATVDAKTGSVTILKNGSASITAKLEAGNTYHGATASYALTVTKGPAALPFSYNSNVAMIGGTSGLEQSGLTSINSQKAQLGFSRADNYLKLSFTGIPGNLSFVLKFNSFKGLYSVEESADGKNFTPVWSIQKNTSYSLSEMVYTIDGALFNPATRHIRWIFTTRGGGSVNLGSIKLEKGTSVATPQFSPEADTFFDAQTITLDCATPEADLYYTFGSEQPTAASTRYTGPFEITATTTIQAIAYVGGEASYIAQKTYTRLYSEVTPESSAVAFSALNIFTLPVSETKTVKITARNLRADLTVGISGKGFSCDKTTLSQSEAEAGAEVAVTYTPTLTDTYTGTLTFTAGELDEPVVVALSGSTYISEKQAAVNEQFEILDDAAANINVGTLLETIGWKGINIFANSSHKMRIGSAKNAGSLTSPTYDLSDPDYDYSVSFVATSYESDKKTITVTRNGDAARTETLTLNATPETYTYALPHSKTASITLAGTSQDNRFHVSAVTIHKTPKKLELVIAGETTHQDINARLALESLTNITLTDAQITSEGSLDAPANPNCLIFSNRPMGFACNEVINGNCEHLKLTDHKPFGTSEAFTAAKATYIRSAYQDGYWESIMLPYNVAADQMPAGYVFDEFTGISDNAVTFTEVTELKAHTPYLMKYIGGTPSDTPAVCTFETAGVTIGQEIVQAQFTGVYNRTATAGKYILGIKDNRSIFGKGGTDSYVSPFRAYLNLVVDENAPALRIIHKPADVTALPGIARQEWSVCNGAAGELIIRTPEAMTGCLAAADGRIIRMLQLEAGEYIIGGLTPGVYIFNKKRVFIK